jgi:hypothetical protein
MNHFRVNARISSVDILTLDRPLKRRTRVCPRVGRAGFLDFTI